MTRTRFALSAGTSEFDPVNKELLTAFLPPVVHIILARIPRRRAAGLASWP
jgi:hypothetical protein